MFDDSDRTAICFGVQALPLCRLASAMPIEQRSAIRPPPPLIGTFGPTCAAGFGNGVQKETIGSVPSALMVLAVSRPSRAMMTW